VPRLAPAVLRFAPGRAAAFRTLSQLHIRYRQSPLSVDGPQVVNCGIRAGERIPDAPYLTKPGFHLLLCGSQRAWPAGTDTVADWPDLVTVHRVEERSAAQYLVRPDGYVGYRAGGTDLTKLRAYMSRWFPGI
jgi:hypothetical protein